MCPYVNNIIPFETIHEFEAENLVIETPFLKDLADNAIERLALFRQWKSESPQQDYRCKFDQVSMQDIVKVLRLHSVSKPSAVRALATIRGIALSKDFFD